MRIAPTLVMILAAAPAGADDLSNKSFTIRYDGSGIQSLITKIR